MLDKKKLSFEAKKYPQLNRIIFHLLTKKSSNKKEINKFKRIGINVLRKNFMKIRDLI